MFTPMEPSIESSDGQVEQIIVVDDVESCDPGVVDLHHITRMRCGWLSALQLEQPASLADLNTGENGGSGLPWP